MHLIMSKILFDNSIEGHEKLVALFTYLELKNKFDLAIWYGYGANENKDFVPNLSKG